MSILIILKISFLLLDILHMLFLQLGIYIIRLEGQISSLKSSRKYNNKIDENWIDVICRLSFHFRCTFEIGCNNFF